MGKNLTFNSVVIATFSNWKDGKRTPTNGMIEPLLSFFGKRSKEIILIDAQHPGSDTIVPVVETHKNGKLIQSKNPPFLFPPLFVLKKFNTLKTQPTFKIRDITTTFEVLLFKKNKTDLFIGLESIYTLVGIIFKKLRKIDTVVYYVSDYSPIRYESKLFNNIYLWLDRLCVMHADYIWDVSPAMMPARLKAGLNPQKVKHVIQVPNALFPFQISYLSTNQLKSNSLLFVGTIGPENGLDLAIEALQIIKEKIPRVILHVLGSGLQSEEEKVQKLIHKYHLENNVKQYGFVFDLKKISDISKHCMVGLAPYRSIPSSVRWYADATKMRLYFANGLPVITTQVPPLGKEAQEKGCALVVQDTKEEFAQAIIEMVSNKKRYEQYRKAAIQFAEKNTWENTYGSALKIMFS